MEQTIEQRAADTILGTSLGTIEIDGTPYHIEPPTTATLVMVSGLISQLPALAEEDKMKDINTWVLQQAEKASPVLAQIAAVLILGAKRIKHHPETTITTMETKEKWHWRYLRKIKVRVPTKTRVNERDHIAERLTEELTPTELKDFTMNGIMAMNLSDFFLLTTSLQERSLLKRTVNEAEVVNSETTTASGALC